MLRIEEVNNEALKLKGYKEKKKYAYFKILYNCINFI